MTPSPPDRRRRVPGTVFVVGMALAVVAALITALSVIGSPAPSRNGAATDPVPVPTTTAPVPTAPPPGWNPTGGEEQAELKLVAVRFVEQIGTWEAGDPRDPTARVVAAGYPAELAEVAAPLLDTDVAAATTVVSYPQLGGLTDTTASVLVAARQQLDPAPGAGTGTVREVTLDVRVVRDGAGWLVSAVIDPPRPALPPAVPGGPTAAGAAVLTDPRVRLPGPARRDVEERRVGDGILEVVAALARTYELEVQVFASGHLGTVFPTTRVSNHAVGRGVDIRAVDGRRIVDIPRDDPVLVAVMVAAGRAGATEVGGPVAVAGRGFFTDAVHQDHLHLGISLGRPPAEPA